MKVYAAFRSVPDYTAGPAPLVSIHLSLHGAIDALYPNEQSTFTERRFRDRRIWTGPDGFGEVREMEVKP